MARTLFFLEALGFAALAGIFPLLAADLAGAFLLPLALALLLRAETEAEPPGRA